MPVAYCCIHDALESWSKSGSCNVAMSTLQLWGTGQDWVKTYESIFGYIWDGHLFASYFEVQWSTNVLIRSHLSQFRLFPSHKLEDSNI
jgi:hypothetical protein